MSEPYFKCKECGGFRIIITAKVDINTVDRHNRVEMVSPDMSDEKDYEEIKKQVHWCNDCKKPIWIEEGTQEEYDEYE